MGVTVRCLPLQGSLRSTWYSDASLSGKEGALGCTPLLDRAPGTSLRPPTPTPGDLGSVLETHSLARIRPHVLVQDRASKQAGPAPPTGLSASHEKRDCHRVSVQMTSHRHCYQTDFRAQLGRDMASRAAAVGLQQDQGWENERIPGWANVNLTVVCVAVYVSSALGY